MLSISYYEKLNLTHHTFNSISFITVCGIETNSSNIFSLASAFSQSFTFESSALYFLHSITLFN